MKQHRLLSYTNKHITINYQQFLLYSEIKVPDDSRSWESPKEADIVGAAGTFSNLALSILLTFSASFVRHVNVKINKAEPENTLQVRS